MSSRTQIKAIVKRQLQQFAAAFGRHARRPRSPQLLVLMYHRVLPDDDARAALEEPGMTVTPGLFRLHLQWIREYFDLVDLSDWLDGTRPRKACAITFDDGWADNYEFAFPVLQELDAPATVFLVSDLIGTRDLFWPERLSRTIAAIATQIPGDWSHPELGWIKELPTGYRFTTLPPTREQLSEIIAGAKIRGDAEIHARLDRIEEQLELTPDKPTPSLLDWSQVAEMAASGLVRAGSHTRRHTRLTDAVAHSVLEDEIVNSKRVIEERTGSPVNTFCFPNGDYSADALELVRANYRGAVTTATGWNRSNTDRHRLQRIGIHQDIAADRSAFLSRIAGWT